MPAGDEFENLDLPGRQLIFHALPLPCLFKEGWAGYTWPLGGRTFTIISLQPRLVAFCCRLRYGAEPSLPPAKLPNRPRQIVRSVLRPHAPRKYELGVRALPQQKIAEPLFPARANQQVH